MLTTTNTIVNQAFATDQHAGRRHRIRINKPVESCSNQEILNSLVSAPMLAMGASARAMTFRENELRKLEHSPLSDSEEDSNDELDVDVEVQANGMAPTTRFTHRKRLPSSSHLGADDGGTPAERAERRYLIRINVGGTSFALLSKHVMRNGPNTLLGRLVSSHHRDRLRLCHLYLERTGEYFFHRSPELFPAIFTFYITGWVHVPEDVCLRNFLVEMKYWQIPFDKIAACCSPIVQDDEEQEEQEDPADEAQPFEGKVCAKLRLQIWRVTESANGGRLWQIYEFMSSTFVLLSILGLILSTLPSLHIQPDNATSSSTSATDPPDFTGLQPTPKSTRRVQSDLTTASFTYQTRRTDGNRMCWRRCSMDSERQEQQNDEDNDDESVEHPFFTYLEYVCVAYFAIDYLIRFLVAPDKREFAMQPLNVIDLIVIAPCLLELIFAWSGLNNQSFRQVRWTIVTVRVLRVLRVLRIAKLGRFSSGLRSFALTMNKSKQHLQMVAVIMITGVVFFSTTVYFLEKDIKDTQFTSIPASFWWCIVTMTTVGYGDAVPETAAQSIVSAGKLIASATIVSGMMVLALPITITVNNFMQVTRMNQSSIHTLASEGPLSEMAAEIDNAKLNNSLNKRSVFMPNGGSSISAALAQNPV